MELQEIDVFIEADGTVKVEIRGVKGKKCIDITKSMEELLGGEVLERNFSDEFNEASQVVLERNRVNIET
ncbi:MAG: DUF2997 domain-containing protein [Deltaproteobacteria bacterium]|nr:DUF2997 domain-containing protein [Deltaproteobacteria bacterium]